MNDRANDTEPYSDQLSEIDPSAMANPRLTEPGRTLSSLSESALRAQHDRPVVLSQDHLRMRRRRTLVPIVLFLLTCVSTFWAGVTQWRLSGVGLQSDVFLAIYNNLWSGLTYMACVLAILFAHEMGHFVATLIHRIPASLPFFIPLPIVSPIGTMGAVIAMDGRRADRREVFDIGIAGPIAGLVFAIPILIYGVMQLDFQQTYYGPAYDSPLLVDLLVGWLRDAPNYRGSIAQGQLNPYFMAGWVGLLITGLNMMPVSQLDGGHVVYTLFGRSAHWVARGFIFFAILFIVFGGALNWLLMLVLVILMGTDHPPTRDDSISLGPLRTAIGFGSLIIPVLCFPPYLFIMP